MRLFQGTIGTNTSFILLPHHFSFQADDTFKQSEFGLFNSLKTYDV